MSRRGRRPVDLYEEDEDEEEEIHEETYDEPDVRRPLPRRRRDPQDERYAETEVFESSRHRPRSRSRSRPLPHIRREPTPPHLVHEVDKLIRKREKARELPERVLRRSRGDYDDDGDGDDDDRGGRRRYEKEYLEEEDKLRGHPSKREETEEVYLRRGPLPRDQDRDRDRDLPRRRRTSRDYDGDDDGERLERRKSRDEEIVFERREVPPRSVPVYKDELDEVVIEDENSSRRRRRRRRPKSREVEESEVEEQDEILVRRHNHSPPREEKPRQRSLLSRDEREKVEEEEEEDWHFLHRDRRPSRRLVRDDCGEVLIRHRDASLPSPRDERERVRRRRRRSMPAYDEEEDDIVLRRRDRSLPAREEDDDDEQDDILIRHKQRRRSRGETDDRDEIFRHRRERLSLERDEDREDDLKIRQTERLHSHRRPPEDDFREEEVRVRRRRSLPPEDEEEEEEDGKAVVRRRLVVEEEKEEDDSREEILVHKGRRDHKKPRALGGSQEEVYIRDEPGRERVKFRHTHGPLSVRSSQSRRGSLELEDITFRHSEREGRGRSRHETEEEQSSPEPAVIRKPPIVQEVITHHRHIESYEKASPRRHGVDDKLRIELDNVDLQEETKGEREERIREEDITIEHGHHDRSSSLNDDEDVVRTHNRSKEIMILEREPEKESLADESDRDRIKEKHKKRYTEVTKDLVVREAIERAGYEYDESAHDFYIYDYLRYDDVSRLVNMTEDIRHARRERMRRRERDMVPPVPPPPVREVYRDREELVEGRRRRYHEV